MLKAQKVEYTFEVGDMFIFQKTDGCYRKGDYIIVSEISGRNLYFTTTYTVNGLCQAAAGDTEWVGSLLNDESISYEGTLVNKLV